MPADGGHPGGADPGPDVFPSQVSTGRGSAHGGGFGPAASQTAGAGVAGCPSRLCSPPSAWARWPSCRTACLAAWVQHHGLLFVGDLSLGTRAWPARQGAPGGMGTQAWAARHCWHFRLPAMRGLPHLCKLLLRRLANDIGYKAPDVGLREGADLRARGLPGLAVPLSVPMLGRHSAYTP